jgi:ribonuclease E
LQTKNEAASLIKRFWVKLVGPSAEPEVKATSSPTVEKVRPTDENQSGRGRNNRRGGRNQGQKSPEPRPNRVPQERDTKPEANKEPRPNRNIRGPGRNVRRNLAPTSNPVDEAVELVKSGTATANEAAMTEATSLAPDISAPAEDHLTRQTARKNTSRRGPNRRRPRNPNYKKAEGEGDSNGGDADLSATDTRNEDHPAQSRSYDNDFAERVERAERYEAQASVSTASEPQNPVTEPAPKAVESIKQDAATE